MITEATSHEPVATRTTIALRTKFGESAAGPDTALGVSIKGAGIRGES